ncbi:ABC transporter permease [Streptomyces coelicoflavus]|uniref:ABC transporter permease n=1 Tax=Streptomyces coelicoflavus TaxID=285562 RepID=UPI0036B8E5F1
MTVRGLRGDLTSQRLDDEGAVEQGDCRPARHARCPGRAPSPAGPHPPVNPAHPVRRSRQARHRSLQQLSQLPFPRFLYDQGDIARSARVAVLGDQAACLLGATRVEDSPAVFFNGHSFTVIGILGGIEREQRLSTSVILPPTTAKDRLGLDTVNRVLINTALGAAHQIARQSPVALAPNSAEALTVLAPPDLSKARKGVQGDVNGLFLVLGLVSLIVGAIGIANVTLVTVMERVGEIGLRRALGASRR